MEYSYGPGPASPGLTGAGLSGLSYNASKSARREEGLHGTNENDYEEVAPRAK